LAKLRQSELTNIQILSDLADSISKVKDFDANALNKTCSVYLYEQNDKHGKALKNEDVFFLFRYAMTGNPVGAPIGEISEVIGKDQVVIRLAAARDTLQKEHDSTLKHKSS
jgi:Anticodon binding domain